MEKGSELAGRLMKISDIHPIIKETFITQQQDIFFLRKMQIEQSQVIEQLVDHIATLVNVNDAMLKKYKNVINKNEKSLRNDENN